MGRAICKDRQDKLDFFSTQRAQIDADRIRLAFVYFAPLTQGSDGTVSNLILQAVDHVTVIGLIETADERLETIAGLNFERRIFAADQAVIALSG